MWKLLSRALGRFDQDQRGNVAVIFAVSAVPLIGLLGGAVDVARHNRYKAELANAMDSAALALVRSGAKNDNEADTFVNKYMATMMPLAACDPMLHMGRFDAITIPGGYRIVASGDMDTAFLPVVGIHEMPMDLETEVMTTGGKYEIALALDNTGSMRNFGRIAALRDAATQLVDDLYKEKGTKDRVKMALVPFVTAVNSATRRASIPPGSIRSARTRSTRPTSASPSTAWRSSTRCASSGRAAWSRVPSMTSTTPRRRRPRPAGCRTSGRTSRTAASATPT